MTISYSSLKDDLKSFISEEYLKNLIDSDSFDYFNKFIDVYKEIEYEDFKKPIFSQTSKFKKIPNNYKNYKYLKGNKNNNEEPKNIWKIETPLDENDKISILIKTYLNKISEDTYKTISNEFIEKLLSINNDKLFEILSYEIINKCLFDIKYRNLYINLCYKIWNNKQIHYNIINIEQINNNYYWNYESEKHGPFTTDTNAKNDAYNKINFKKYFLNHIQKIYKLKDINLEGLSDDEFFNKKQKILLLVELIGILYLEKYISFDIINLIIIDLLHLNDNLNVVNQ